MKLSAKPDKNILSANPLTVEITMTVGEWHTMLETLNVTDSRKYCVEELIRDLKKLLEQYETAVGFTVEGVSR